MEHIESIPKAGACLATRNVIEQKGLVRWMVRGESQVPADNGWQIMSQHRHLGLPQRLFELADRGLQ